MPYKIPIEKIKFICQQCGLSDVKFGEQCFLCGEINWSDETLDRLNSMRNVEITLVTCVNVEPTWHQKDKYQGWWTFGVYPKSFKMM